KAKWIRIERGGLTFLIAMCGDHRIVAVLCSVDKAKFFKWATTDFERSLMKLGRGNRLPKRPVDRCTHCRGRMHTDCDNWLCKKCCVKFGYNCSVDIHETEEARPEIPLMRIKDHLWHGEDEDEPAPVEREIIDVDEEPEVIVIDDDEPHIDEDSRAPRGEEADLARAIQLSLLTVDEESRALCGEEADIARAIQLSLLSMHAQAAQQDDEDDEDDPYVEDGDLSRATKLSRWAAARLQRDGAGPSRLADDESRTIRVRVSCEHLWEANAARESGDSIYRTVVTVPASRGEQGEFFESDLTDAALADLKLNRRLLKKVRVWDDNCEKYLLDPCFAWEVKYSMERRMQFVIVTAVEDLEDHVELTKEEKHRNERRDEDELRPVLVRVEVFHYEKKGYCQGELLIATGDCYVRRRRFYIEDCKVALSDLCENARMALDLEDTDVGIMDDGEYRPGGITMDTPLNAVPWTSDTDDHELKLVIRVHGSAAAYRKRRRPMRGSRRGKGKGKGKGKAKAKEDEEDEEDEEETGDYKRRKTA
ncbi:hypothetical protein AURDEDRAFT_175067, partial [Auricularia subglabra TFB-10046 SS5]